MTTRCSLDDGERHALTALDPDTVDYYDGPEGEFQQDGFASCACVRACENKAVQTEQAWLAVGKWLHARLASASDYSRVLAPPSHGHREMESEVKMEMERPDSCF